MKTVGKEYGNALFSLAAEERCEDAVLDGLRLIQELFDQNPDYVRLLSNPAVAADERLALLDSAFRGHVHPYVLNTAKLLCEKSALAALPQCIREYTALLYEQRGILLVTVVSAVEMDGTQKDALKSRLESTTGKTVLLDCRVDPSIIGGVRVSYAGKEMDGSVAGRLAALRQALMA